MVAEEGADYLGFASFGVAAVEPGGKQSSTGQLHLDGFSPHAKYRMFPQRFCSPVCGARYFLRRT